MTITIPASILRDIITGTLTCTSTDVTLPTLCCVRIGIGHNQINTQATDRYRAMFAGYTLPEGFTTEGCWTALVDRKEMKKILGAIPKGKGTEYLPVTVSVDGKSMIFDWVTGAITVRTSEGSHPELSKVIPSDDALLGLPGGTMHLNAKYLATMDEVPGSRNMPWKVQFHGASKPMTATRAGEGEPSWLYLQMPVSIH